MDNLEVNAGNVRGCRMMDLVVSGLVEGIIIAVQRFAPEAEAIKSKLLQSVGRAFLTVYF